jgi:hypothetical protein
MALMGQTFKSSVSNQLRKARYHREIAHSTSRLSTRTKRTSMLAREDPLPSSTLSKVERPLPNRSNPNQIKAPGVSVIPHTNYMPPKHLLSGRVLLFN